MGPQVKERKKAASEGRSAHGGANDDDTGTGSAVQHASPPTTEYAQ